jgi:hypothetical protein
VWRIRRLGIRAGGTDTECLYFFPACKLRGRAAGKRNDRSLPQGCDDKLQKNTTAFFVKIERQGGSDKEDYKNYTQFYDDSKVAVKSLLIRAGATGQNEKTEGQIKALLDKYNSLENQHRQFGLTPNIIPITETSFEVLFRAILTQEVAKKDLK